MKTLLMAILIFGLISSKVLASEEILLAAAIGSGPSSKNTSTSRSADTNTDPVTSEPGPSAGSNSIILIGAAAAGLLAALAGGGGSSTPSHP